METRTVSTDTPETLKLASAEAVALLGAGEVVALPTETVYGLAVDALDARAVAKVFEIKERPDFDPLIVHVTGQAMLEVAEASETVKEITGALWPGPLTVVLPKKNCVPDIVTSGLDTVAVRMSGDPVFRKVAKLLGRPIAAPSANRFGRISPTSASAVQEELGGRIPLVLDGGGSAWGLESTIIKVEEKSPKALITILRPGPVTKEDLKKFGKVVLSGGRVEKVEVPGQSESHYAPSTPLRLLEAPSDFVPEPGRRYALLSYRGGEKDGYLGLTDYEHVAVLSPGSGKLPEAGVRLFFIMRQLDALGVDEIIAEPVPERGVGLAILDRLRRASI